MNGRSCRVSSEYNNTCTNYCHRILGGHISSRLYDQTYGLTGKVRSKRRVKDG